MTSIGYTLSGEEHRPNALVRYASQAEEAGFDFAMISDHFHPWIDAQGQSPFAWTVLGGVAHATHRMRVGTAVTAPIIRYHPALMAQMAATTADMFEGRFFLGLGSGENLNEHILGDHWPAYGVRREMLAEAVQIIRELWRGELTTHYGAHYVVENARIYTLPDELPPIYLAASGPESATLAGQIGDGLISTAPKREILDTFRSTGGGGKPRYGQVTLAWGPDEQEARQMLLRQWPTSGIPGESQQELPLPKHFEELASIVTADQLAKQVPCGPDPRRHVAAIRKFSDAGYDHVLVHQVGPDQEGFLRFYRDELAPALGDRQTTDQASETAAVASTA